MTKENRLRLAKHYAQLEENVKQGGKGAKRQLHKNKRLRKYAVDGDDGKPKTFVEKLKAKKEAVQGAE